MLPVAALDTEQLGQLFDHDEDREAEDEPLDHGSREELRDEPESRNSPASRNKPPQIITIAAASTTYALDDAGWSTITVEASRTAAAEVPAATSCLLVPKIAYAASVTSSV